ncbi:hypothetical protein AALO_G00191280 [Alosa alosa]|uniref:Uncharacterized protein n=1 Tax=Alosa alosa TaxID=278164 RepID=A0AAV6G8W0_9TELE|nr:hypothetical protein AALO_G00191280 [Alosa alosa]
MLYCRFSSCKTVLVITHRFKNHEKRSAPNPASHRIVWKVGHPLTASDSQSSVCFPESRGQDGLPITRHYFRGVESSL